MGVNMTQNAFSATVEVFLLLLQDGGLEYLNKLDFHLSDRHVNAEQRIFYFDINGNYSR